MYRRPKFLEALLAIRRDMAREADYDVDLLAELARTGKRPQERNNSPADEVPRAKRALLTVRASKRG